MLLAVDVGNTQTVLGLYDGERARRALARGDRGRAHRRRDRRARRPPARAARPGLRGRRRRRLSSTVPPLVRAYEELADRYAHAPLLVVGPGTKTGIPILFDDPREVGPDRIVNAVAAPRALRRALHRRRLRHLDELRRGLGGRGVRRRRDRARDRDLHGRALRAGGAPRQGRPRRAGHGDRQDDGGRAPGRARLRLRRPGGRHRRADARTSSAAAPR